MNYSLYFWPPAALILVLFVVVLLTLLATRLGARATRPEGGKTRAYACGEDVKVNRVPPEYRQFFPFAFFFTIMHVVALMVTTAPPGHPWASLLAGGYLLSAGVGLFILYRS